MAYRADAADALHDERQLVERAALAELLEAAKLRKVKAGVLDVPLVIQVNCYFRVPLDAGYRRYYDILLHRLLLLSEPVSDLRHTPLQQLAYNFMD